MSAKERALVPKLKLDWDAGRTERLLADVHTHLDRRKRALRFATGASTLALLVCIGTIALRRHPTPAALSPSNDPSHGPASPGVIRFGDGSEIRIDPASSEIRVLEENAARVSVDVVRGRSHYIVTPNPERSFEVRCGAVTVTVVGTEFAVERRADAAWVEVTRGKVRVSWDKERVLLTAGESGIFPRQDAPSVAEEDLSGHDDVDTRTGRGGRATQVYRSRVARHDYRGAYAVLTRNPALAGDTVEELLVAADVARLSDHPSEAVPYLQRVIREHPRDERAPMAAFTLGRTLSGLGRTEEAMNMFGRVHAAWPKSPLAEDALLRQAEAASQLGDIAAARRVAEQYDRDYPNGRRRFEVRRYARLE